MPWVPRTLPLLLPGLRQRGDAPRLYAKAQGRWQPLSCRGFYDQVRAATAGLERLGLHAGERAVLLAESSPQWLIADFACQALGVANVPVYPTLTAEQTAFPARHSRARLALVSNQAQRQKLEAQANELPALRWIVCFDDGDEFSDPSIAGIVRLRWRELLETPPPPEAEFEARLAAIAPEQTATLLYTSGTTGVPKAAPLTHANLCANLEQTTRAFALGADDRRLSVLPLSHITERHLAYLDMVCGMTTWFAESIEAIAANLRETRPTVLAAVPRMYEKIAAAVRAEAAARPRILQKVFAWAQSTGQRMAPYRLEDHAAPWGLRLADALADRLVYRKLRARLGGELRIAMSGGAALPRETAEFLLSLGWRLDQGYGMTETSPVIAMSRPGSRRLGSVGRPMANLELRFAEDGEILVRGPSVFAGYEDDPEATAAAFTNGWFHTGDLGRLDQEGFLYISGRKKELLKTAGGKFISPQPLEDKLKASPWIAEAMVVGEGRPYASVLILPDFAALEARARQAGWRWRDRAELCALPQARALYADEIEALNRSLARFETLKRFLLLTEEFSVAAGELTPTLKIRRAAIEAKYRTQIDQLYAS